MPKKVCIVCENILHLDRGKSLQKCSLCHNPVCDRDWFPCCICGNEVCTNHLVNFDPSLRYGGKTSAWKFLKCKSCARTEKAVIAK